MSGGRPTSVTLREFWSLRHAAGGSWVTVTVFQHAGAVAAHLAFRAGLRPNAVTVASGVVGLGGAAALLGAAHSAGRAAATVLLFWVAYALDCADGQLARATRRTSAFGARLDLVVDGVLIVALGVAVPLAWAHHPVATGTRALLGLAAGLLALTRVLTMLVSARARRRDKADRVVAAGVVADGVVAAGVVAATDVGAARELYRCVTDTPVVVTLTAVATAVGPGVAVVVVLALTALLAAQAAHIARRLARGRGAPAPAPGSVADRAAGGPAR